MQSLCLLTFLYLVQEFYLKMHLKIMIEKFSVAHTHLYTRESLEYLFKKNNLKIIGEWCMD